MLGGGTAGGGADGLLHFGQLCIGLLFLCAVRGRLERQLLSAPLRGFPVGGKSSPVREAYHRREWNGTSLSY